MLRVIIFLALLSPGIYLLVSVFSAVDPIKYIYTYTGLSALSILVLSLCISPLKKIYNMMKYRRMVGLFAFFYAFLHFLNFVILDAQLDFAFVVKETLDKPFIYLGMIAFLILLAMALTSSKKLFAKYNKWHKLVYIALILVVIHESMAQKVLGLLEYGFIFIAIVLLALRKTFFQKLISKDRK